MSPEVYFGSACLVKDKLHFLEKLASFRGTPNSNIALLLDYDGTISPHLNSWDVPGLYDPNWREIALEQRRLYQIGVSDEEGFWRASITALQENGFARQPQLFANACFPVREGIVQLFHNFADLGQVIVYSAGIEQVIAPHMQKIATTFGTREPLVVANRLDSEFIIHGGNKNGTTLLQALAQRNTSLAGITHFVLIGDSPRDTHMAAGLDAVSTLSMGLITRKKAADRTALTAYTNAYDILFVADEGLGDMNEYIEHIVC